MTARERCNFARPRVASWLGLSLCALVPAAFMLSLGHDLGVSYVNRHYRTYSLSLRRGWLRCGLHDPEVTTRSVLPIRGISAHWKRTHPRLPPDHLHLPYRGAEYEGGPDWQPLYVLPAWPLALAAAAGMLCFGPRLRRRPGTCSSCGYDLSGLDPGPCPECGSNGTLQNH